MTGNVVTVIVVEDQWMVRDGLATIANLADHIEVVATGADGNDAIALVAEHEPAVVLMDIKMPNLDGIEATRQLTQTHPTVNVLVLTTFVDHDLITQALEAGASGYLTKDISAEDLADAITAAARGLVQLSPAAAQRLSSTTASRYQGDERSDLQSAIDDLTPRERDVLRVLSTGATNAEIAAELFLSAGTVKNHVSSILRQLGLSDRTRAAIVANRYDLGRSETPGP